jgi:hypothetical protein
MAVVVHVTVSVMGDSTGERIKNIGAFIGAREGQG